MATSLIVSCPYGARSCFKNGAGRVAIGNVKDFHLVKQVTLEKKGFEFLKIRQRTAVIRLFRPVSPLASSSFSSSVEKDEFIAEEAFDDIGDSSADSAEIPSDEMSRSDLMKEVVRRLSEQDLEEAAKKYNYEDELFSQIDFAQINAFTDKPFSGNPAAVCYLPYEKGDNWLQLIASEFNISATAFLVKRRLSKNSSLSKDNEDGDEPSPLIEADKSGVGFKAVKKNLAPVENEFDIRWFTPKAELTLCGHATLASSHLLFSSGIVEGDTIVFHSKFGGILKARKVSGYEEYDEPPPEPHEEEPESFVARKPPSGKGVVELDFPINAATECDASEAQEVKDTLKGVEIVWVGKSAVGDYLVELSGSNAVQEVEPQLEKMKHFGDRGGVIVTARGTPDSNFDFVSRFFCPKLGITEDPVTGSAHCTLGPYWARKLGKANLKAYQASSRGGQLVLRVDESSERVFLQGGAVLVMAGTLLNTFG